ncbi:hypothetical protein D3C74_206900 [compost metagenome]
MLHSELIIEKKKTLFSEGMIKNIPEKYHIQKNVLYSPVFFNNLTDDMHPIEFKLFSVVHQYLHLFPNTIATVIENEEIEFEIVDELKQYLALITWKTATTNQQSIQESIISRHVKQLMDFIANKEDKETLDLKLHKLDEEARKYGDAIFHLPREDQAEAIISALTTGASHLLQQALPIRAFIAVYQKVHNELKHTKGVRKEIQAYKNHKLNLTSDRKLHNRYWNYFCDSLQNESLSEKNLNLMLFEWEYSFVLASQINSATKELPDDLKCRSRKVLSLAALLPTVESRLSLIQYYTEHQKLILEESLWGAPKLSVKAVDVTDAMLKLASELIAMSLLVIPILEINTQRMLTDEDKTLLENLSESKPLYLKLKDTEDIENTLLAIHHVQSLYRNNKLWDLESIINDFLKEYPDNNFSIDNREIELIGTFVRDKYFGDFLK